MKINEEYSEEKLEEIKKKLTCKERTKYEIYQLDNNYCLFLTSMYFERIEDFINLELTIPRMNGNMTKFHYNPISITQQTREFFPNLQTLYTYTKEDELFQEDERIKERKIIKVKKYDLFINQIKQIEEWTGLKCEKMIFDSEKDDWNEKTSIFTDRIMGKKQLTFIIEDKDNEIFGYYLNTTIIEKYGERIPTDVKSFEFNLESKGRIPKPMKFEIKDITNGGYRLCSQNSDELIYLGNIFIRKKQRTHFSYCNQISEKFEYHNINKAICGRLYNSGQTEGFFIPTRIIVIQMK